MKMIFTTIFFLSFLSCMRLAARWKINEHLKVNLVEKYPPRGRNFWRKNIKMRVWKIKAVEERWEKSLTNNKESMPRLLFRRPFAKELLVEMGVNSAFKEVGLPQSISHTCYVFHFLFLKWKSTPSPPFAPFALIFDNL